VERRRAETLAEAAGQLTPEAIPAAADRQGQVVAVRVHALERNRVVARAGSQRGLRVGDGPGVLVHAEAGVQTELLVEQGLVERLGGTRDRAHVLPACVREAGVAPLPLVRAAAGVRVEGVAEHLANAGSRRVVADVDVRAGRRMADAGL